MEKFGAGGAVVNTGGGDCHRQQEAECVSDDVPLTANDVRLRLSIRQALNSFGTTFGPADCAA